MAFKSIPRSMTQRCKACLPARHCVSLLTGTPRRAGPPYGLHGLPAQANTRGVNFGRRWRVNIQRRLTDIREAFTDAKHVLCWLENA
jgi:hypothetical protein